MNLPKRSVAALGLSVLAWVVGSNNCDAGYAFDVKNNDSPRVFLRFEETQASDPADNEGTSGGTQDGDYDRFEADGSPKLEEAGIPGGGTAVGFFTDNSQVFIPDTASPTAYTLEVWVKPNSIRSQNILVRTNNNPQTSFSHQIRMTSSGQFEAYTYDGGGRTVTGTTTATTNSWYHVVATASNSGTLNLFVNGVAEGTPDVVGTLWTGGDEYRAGSIAGVGTWYDGTLDELAIYDYVLSDTRILAHYNSGSVSPVPEPSSFLLLAALCCLLGYCGKQTERGIEEPVTSP